MHTENISSSSDNDFEVEDILDYRIVSAYDRKKKRFCDAIEYKIKWVGCKRTTWELESDLAHCQEMLANFKKRHMKPKRNAKKAKKKGYLKYSLSHAPQTDSEPNFQSVSVPKSCGDFLFQDIPKSNDGERSHIIPKCENKNSFFYEQIVPKKINFANELMTEGTDINDNEGDSLDIFKENNNGEEKKNGFEKKKNVEINNEILSKNSGAVNNSTKEYGYDANIINNYGFRNKSSEIESLKVLKVIAPFYSLLQNTISVEARISIKEPENDYLIKASDEELKQYYYDAFQKTFKGKILKYK